MDLTTLVGTVGGVILVAGAAYPDRPGIKPVRSAKDWLLSLGALVMMTYSIRNYIAGGSVFFIFLQALVILSSIFMMADTPDTIDTPIMGVATVGLIIWSLCLSLSLNTVFFILGLGGVAMGYCSTGGTKHREIALTLGSILIALFSWLTATWVFFWLNLFFAIFSGWQLFRMGSPRHPSVF